MVLQQLVAHTQPQYIDILTRSTIHSSLFLVTVHCSIFFSWHLILLEHLNILGCCRRGCCPLHIQSADCEHRILPPSTVLSFVSERLNSPCHSTKTPRTPSLLIPPVTRWLLMAPVAAPHPVCSLSARSLLIDYHRCHPARPLALSLQRRP